MGTHRGSFGAAGGGVGLGQQNVGAGVHGEVAAAAQVQVGQRGALRAHQRSLLALAHLPPVNRPPLPAHATLKRSAQRLNSVISYSG